MGIIPLSSIRMGRFTQICILLAIVSLAAGDLIRGGHGRRGRHGRQRGREGRQNQSPAVGVDFNGCIPDPQKPYLCCVEKRKPSTPSKRSPSWNVPTKRWRSAITPMSHNSPRPKRRSAKRTLRSLVKLLSSNRLSRKKSRSVTGPRPKYAMDKAKKSAKLSTNHLVPPDISRSHQVNSLVTPNAKNFPLKFAVLVVCLNQVTKSAIQKK